MTTRTFRKLVKNTTAYAGRISSLLNKPKEPKNK